MILILRNINKYLLGKEKEIRLILIVFFFVGFLGVAIQNTRILFINLTPLALLLSFLVLITFHESAFWKKELFVFMLILLISFFIEAVGVNYGFVFGNYIYGDGLGIKILGTPLLIGINWVLLVYCTSVISEKLPAPVFLKILTASSLMLVYDVIMEQVAPKMDMWLFEGGVAPLRNYISWFILALVFQSILGLTGIRLKNRLSTFILLCQGAFFILLFIFFKIAK
jgi:bisanhydrobacterioruberin hydratase